VQRNDDDAWRAIIDNYGDRAELEIDEAAPEATAAPEPTPREQPSWDDEYPDSDWDTDSFVPPEPPPLPTTTTDRLIAWLGVFGAPAILLVCMAFGLAIPSLVAYLLVASFVGGFLYLVIKMNREPRDPDDNGAVL